MKLTMGIFGNRRNSKVAEQELAAERRKKFLETFGDVSVDGHGERVETSEVLDNDTHFDLHNAPSKPPVVDDKDFVAPAPLWTAQEEAERRLNPAGNKEMTEEEIRRREKFNAFFDTVPADELQGPIPDRRSLDNCKFENMPIAPPADPMIDPEEKKKENLKWYDYSEVKLTPQNVPEDPEHRRRVETFEALYNNVNCNTNYPAVH